MLQNNSNIVELKHINTIGIVLNCIINDLNQIPTENDIQNMQNNINNSTSKVRSMAGDYIRNSYEKIKRWTVNNARNL